MFCRNCGKALPDNSRFCPHCGSSQLVNPSSNSSDNENSGIGSFFVKKVFIGSIVSFVVGTIGIIAIFFPNVFNMEKANINEFNKEIKTPSDAKTLYDFLIQNNKKIVKLELVYTPERYLKADYTTSPGEMVPDLMYDFVGCPSNLGEGEHNSCSVNYRDYFFEEKGPKLDNKMFFMDPSNRQKFIDADTGKLLVDASKYDLFGFEIGSVVPFELLGLCNVNDIPCQLNIKEYAKYPLAGLLFKHQLYPGLDYKNRKDLSDHGDEFPRPKTLTNEVVLYGGNYNFSAAHKKIHYKDNIEYVDQGTLSFILNESTDAVPVYLIEESAFTDDADTNANCNIIKLDSFARKYVEPVYMNDCSYAISSAIAVDDNGEVEYTDDPSKSMEKTIFKTIEDGLIVKKNGKSPLVSNIYNNSYQIQIKDSSQDNSLYKWNSTKLSDNFPKFNEQLPIYGNPKVQMQIFGYFLVNVNKNSNVDEFPPQFCNYQQTIAMRWIRAGVEDSCRADVIILDPLSLKDIEQSKYK
jgi:hypothetical protein